MATLGVIEEQIPEYLGCPVLDRLKAFEVTQGTKPTLQLVFRDKDGKPVDLSAYLGDSDSVSNSDTPRGSAFMRLREYLGRGLDGVCDNIWEYEATSPDPSKGILLVKVNDNSMDEAGIYEANWGIFNADDELIANQQAIVSVERSLWAPIEQLKRRLGPPTIREIRMAMRDSVTTNLLLDGYEFGAEEIWQAVYRPIDEWNSTPPDVLSYTTKTFPHREYWMKAITGYLYFTAAAFYRRNTQNYSGGGMTKTDLDREKEYLNVANALKFEWTEFMLGKKRTHNANLFVGYM